MSWLVKLLPSKLEWLPTVHGLCKYYDGKDCPLCHMLVLKQAPDLLRRLAHDLAAHAIHGRISAHARDVIARVACCLLRQ